MEDKDGASAFQIFQKLDHDGRLDLRCWAALPGQDLDNIIDLGLRTWFGNDRLLVGHVKFFSDEGSVIQHGPHNNRIYNFLPKFPGSRRHPPKRPKTMPKLNSDTALNFGENCFVDL